MGDNSVVLIFVWSVAPLCLLWRVELSSYWKIVLARKNNILIEAYFDRVMAPDRGEYVIDVLIDSSHDGDTVGVLQWGFYTFFMLSLVSYK